MNYIGKKFQIILTGNFSWLLNLCSYFIISCFFPLSWKGGTYICVIWCESADMRRGFDSHFQNSDKTNDRFASKFDQSLSFYSELAVFSSVLERWDVHVRYMMWISRYAPRFWFPFSTLRQNKRSFCLKIWPKSIILFGTCWVLFRTSSGVPYWFLPRIPSSGDRWISSTNGQ